jgi:hypothetical protein
MKKPINEFARMQQLAGINEIKVRTPTSHNIYYVHDKEGMEEPIGPFNLEQANNERRRLGAGYDIMDEKTAKEIYSYLNEIKVRTPTSRVEDFLNQYKEEVFEKMFSYINDNDDDGDIDIDINGMTDWEGLYDDDFDYTFAQVDFPDVNIGAQARFEPFPPEYIGDTGDSKIDEVEIAGRKVYYFTYSY